MNLTPVPSPPPNGLAVLSQIPGRVRWMVGGLRGAPGLAAFLESDLGRHPHVSKVRANAVTGTLLLVFGPEYTPPEAAGWVEAALERAPEAPEAPAAGSAVVGFGRPPRDHDAERPSHLGRILAATSDYPDLQRRAIALSVADAIANGVPPLLVGLAVGAVANPSTSLLTKLGFATTRARVAALGVIGVGFWAVASALEYHRERTASELADRVRRDLRLRLYQHVQSLDVATVEGRGASTWMAVIDGDVDEVHRFLRHGGKPLMAIFSNVVIVGATFIMVSPALGAVQLLVIPPLLIASKQMLAPLRERMVEARNRAEGVSGMIAGNLSGIGTVASFAAEDDQLLRIRDAAESHLEASRESSHFEAAYVPTLRAIVGGGFVATVAWGSAKVAAGTMSVAGLDTMAYGQLRLMSALARGGTGVEEFQRTSAALERIYTTLDTRSDLEDGSRTLVPELVEGDLVFDGVTFGYDPRTPVVSGLSLNCPAGKTTAIVGASGAGKSTLLRLLQRFHDPQNGSVTIDGVGVNEFRLATLRGAMAVVPQEVTLFSGTIRENIALGEPDAAFDRVVRAARIAEAHEFISALPMGYETRIGFGGVTLSGGQRQRIAIARALLVNRPILLFDEATSSLDHITEASIQRSLATATDGRTTLIIAHRLSTVRNAHLIHVLDEGQLIESGSHDELIERGGMYASMWRIQTGEARSSDGMGGPGARRS